MLPEAKVRSRVTMIEPAEAIALVDRFYAGTKVNQKLVQSYGRDMAEGRWKLNGAPIIFSKDGRVLDGRIRLLACLHSQAAFETLIIEGIDPEAFETIDAVRKRTLADVLSIRRERHGRPLAAALRIIWAYTNGVIGAARSPSSVTLLNLLENHPEIRDSIIPSLRVAPLLPHGCGIALHFLMSLVDAALCDRFFSVLAAEGLDSRNGPVSQLRRVLSELKGRGGTRKQAYILAVTIKAWNSFSTGKNLKKLKYSPDREPFPRITGLDLNKKSKTAGIEEDAAAMSQVSARSRHKGSLSARVEMITPEMAEEFLANNTLNRRVSGSVVQKYARDMTNGKWRLNGQTIKISATGRLLDGQHRLEAAKKARRPFPAIIVQGVSEETLSSLDVGHRRSLGEILRERGESNTAVLASSLRWLWMLENEVILASNISPTNSELLDLLERNPELRQSLKLVSQVRELMGSGIACALHYMFSGRDCIKADEFFARLIDGVQLAATSPVYHLRERLIKTRSSHRVRLAEAERVALTIKAWNAFREDRPLQQLSWRNRGVTREALPSPL